MLNPRKVDLIICVSPNATSLVHYDRESFQYRVSQQILSQQSFNKLLCFCGKNVVHFSSYFCWQFTSIDLLSLQDSFLLRSHSCKTLCSTQYLCLLMKEQHSVWFSSVLLFFGRLLGMYMHGVWLPSNKAGCYLHIIKGFLSLSILVLLEDFSCNKNCWSMLMLLRGGICFFS